MHPHTYNVTFKKQDVDIIKKVSLRSCNERECLIKGHGNPTIWLEINTSTKPVQYRVVLHWTVLFTRLKKTIFYTSHNIMSND